MRICKLFWLFACFSSRDDKLQNSVIRIMKHKANHFARLFPIFGIVLLLLLSGCSGLNVSSDAESRFVSIFDGETLNGWKGDPVYWRVEDGNLVGEITPETIVDRNTFIIWQEGQPADFELKLEYRISSRGNSGINYRSQVMDDHPYALTGYQADMDGRNLYTGQNYEERGRTTLAYRGQKTVIPPLDAPLGPDGLRPFIQNNAWTKAVVTEELGDRNALAAHITDEDWNSYHIIAKGNHLQHFINGVLMSDVTDNDDVNRRNSGYIGVQVHVGPPMKVEFRNIMLKELK